MEPWLSLDNNANIYYYSLLQVNLFIILNKRQKLFVHLESGCFFKYLFSKHRAMNSKLDDDFVA